MVLPVSMVLQIRIVVIYTLECRFYATAWLDRRPALTPQIHDTPHPHITAATNGPSRGSITGFQGTRHEAHAVVEHRVAPAGQQ